MSSFRIFLKNIRVRIGHKNKASICFVFGEGLAVWHRLKDCLPWAWQPSSLPLPPKREKAGSFKAKS